MLGLFGSTDQINMSRAPLVGLIKAQGTSPEELAELLEQAADFIYAGLSDKGL